jgi:hemoglobin/transferrin/lactoferrin receptor protein
MQKAFALGMGLALSICAYGQNDSTIINKNLEEVIIYSNKFLENKKNIVQKIDVISSKQIAQLNSQNTGDLLSNTGNVFVQKSQQGGSSPVIRGFEASRVLLVIDGIRMNNAIYRAGHLQNVITVDQNMLERVEVLYGPASTIYGSDALGGVIHLRTKSPLLSSNEKLLVKGTAFARYSSASNEKTGHLDLSIGGKRLGWLQSYNFSDFGDTKMGRNYPDKYPDFGRRTQYITNKNGVDSIVKNDDDRIQRFSGYQQWDITQKFLYKQSSRINHSINLQFSNSSNVPRYDRLQDIRNGSLRFAEWYYGPQKRNLAAYELNVDSSGFFTNLKALISFQQVEESRHQRDYKRYDRLDNRLEKLNVWAFNIDGRKLWKRHELTTGIDGQFNDVRSTAFRKNILTGEVSKLDTRYPNGENNMNNFGIYAQHIFKFYEGKLVLNDGVRLQATSLHSTIADNSFFNFPFTEIEQNNLAITGNIGLAYMPSDATRINSSISTGFRAPNVDDASRILESNTASKQLIVPNPNIDPEYTYNVDLGIAQNLFSNVRLEVTGFYTWFKNAIALAPFQFKGKDSVDYNGSTVKVFANQNVNKAFVYGFNASVSAAFLNHFNLSSTINYTHGRLKPLGNQRIPLDHIPPLYGKTSLNYNNQKLNFDLYALYNGWKKIEEYNPSGEDNAQYATKDGTPSWLTLNLKSSVVLNKYFSLQAGVENILDCNYRYFASGFSAPGRNYILALICFF